MINWQSNCPINERTADGVLVGRCWMRLSGERGMECERHGDVSEAVKKYILTGKLTDENELRAARKPHNFLDTAKDLK